MRAFIAASPKNGGHLRAFIAALPKNGGLLFQIVGLAFVVEAKDLIVAFGFASGGCRCLSSFRTKNYLICFSHAGALLGCGGCRVWFLAASPKSWGDVSGFCACFDICFGNQGVGSLCFCQFPTKKLVDLFLSKMLKGRKQHM